MALIAPSPEVPTCVHVAPVHRYTREVVTPSEVAFVAANNWLSYTTSFTTSSTGVRIPALMFDQVAPSQLAMLFTPTPPAELKSPPAISALLKTTSVSTVPFEPP